jgi:hypothetical protein
MPLQDLRDALDNQQVFAALMAASAAEDLVASIGDVSASRVIEILEPSWTSGNGTTVATRMMRADQFRDCLSGIEGDWTRANWNNDGHRFSFQYRLPALVNRRRNSETVRDPDNIPGLALLVVPSALRDVPNSETITDWHLKRAFIELPDGRVFAARAKTSICSQSAHQGSEPSQRNWRSRTAAAAIDFQMKAGALLNEGLRQ